MNLYLWEMVGPVNDRYHGGGSVLIAAESLDAARIAWAEYLSADDIMDTSAVSVMPDRVWSVGDAPAEVRVFEDAGCC